MLYKFKSKVTADLIMLQPHGHRLLEIIGKDNEPGDRDQGIILPEQMAQAIAALEAAIAQEEAIARETDADELPGGGKSPRFETITLRQRAQPFIEMLRRCRKENCEVVWGV